MSYLVWDPEACDREDAQTFDGYDAGAAAEAWAHRSDPENDYVIIAGSSVVVHTVDLDTGEEQSFSLTGEQVPSYHARAVAAPG